ncbi:hypothetical protein INR49_022732 [Caranx melampygus]|nr:hypothetical protein INR49_022732 [Caranx melampygus]
MLLFLLLLPVCSGQVTDGGVHYGVVVTYHPKEMNSTGLTVFLGNWTNNTVNGVMRSRIVGLIELRNRSDTGRANSSPQTTIVPVLRVPVNCQRDFNLLAFDPDGDEVKCRYGSTRLFECDPCSPPSALSISSLCSLSFTPTNTSIEGLYVVQLMMEDFPRQNIILTHFNGSREIRTPNDTISKIPVQFVVDVDPAVRSCTEGLYLPRFLPPTPANGAHLFIPDLRAAAQRTLQCQRDCIRSGQYTLTWTPPEKEDGQSLPICFVVQAVHNSTKYHSELRCVIVSVGNDPPPEHKPQPLHRTQPHPSATTHSIGNNPSTEHNTPPDTTTTHRKQPLHRPQPPPLATTTPLSTTTPPNTTTPPETTTPPATTTPPETTPGPEQIVLRLTVRTSSLFPLSEDTKTSIISELRDELIRRGLPSNFTLVYQDQVEASATPPPAGRESNCRPTSQQNLKL